MNKIATLEQSREVAQPQHFSPKQIEILKNSLCKGVSNEEFEIFLMACTKTQLDPFMRQIYAVKRKARKPDGSWGETMTIQTGIDGYRLIAERTGCYAPGPEPTYFQDGNGRLASATAYIKKQTKDGTWHTVSASAYMDEFCQKKSDGAPMGMWGNMPRTMLAKCAEAQALRKAFPAEMSGIYTKEEMAQAEVEEIAPRISLEQVSELEMILGDCEKDYRDWVMNHLKTNFKVESLCNVPAGLYDKIKAAALKNMEATRANQQKQIEAHAELVTTDVK